MAKRLKKKEVRNTGRRALSLLLSLVMCISLVQISAFAAEGTVDLPEVEIADKGEVTTVTGDKGTSISGSKMIEKVVGTENEFEITLNVNTVSTSETSIVAGDAAHIVLVIDRSGSMGKNYGNAIVDAKKAAKDFTEIFLGEDASANNQMAVVSYASDVRTDVGMTGKDGLDDVLSKIDGISAEGGTLIQGGIKQAQAILEANHVDGVKDIIVLMSDGAPTYSYKATAFTRENADIPQQDGGTYGAVLTEFDSRNVVGSGSSADLGWIRYYIAEWRDLFVVTDNILPTLSQAKLAKEDPVTSTEIYSVLLASQETDNSAKHTLRYCATDEAHYRTGSADDLAEIFKDIANTVISTASASIVTDPMSSYIHSINENSIVTETADGEAVVADNTLSWDLSKAQPKSQTTETVNGVEVTTTVYELTYKITVDRTLAFYEAVAKNGSVPTNGTTSMPYTLGEKSGTLSFKVPSVKSDMPEVPYTITHSFQDREDTSKYDLDSGKTVTGKAPLFSKITVEENSKGDYVFEKGPKGEQTLNNLDNHFDLFYKLTPVTVVVNQYTVTTTSTDGGEVVTGPTLVTTDTYPSADGNAQYYQGDSFTFPAEDMLDSSVYQFAKSVEVDGTTYTSDRYERVELSQGQTVINLYYTNAVEQRTEVHYEVHYFWRENSWVLNGDKYELVEGEYIEDSSDFISGKGFLNTTYTAPDKNPGEYDWVDTTYTGDGKKTSDFSVTLGEKNVINVYYEKEGPKPATATLTIVHKYFENTINGLQPVPADDWTELDHETVYVGETWYANPNLKGYTLLTTDPAKRTAEIAEAGKNYCITVEYVRDVRESVEIVENHYYITYTWTVDAETGEGAYEQTASSALEGLGPDKTYYAGQTYTPRTLANGYTLNEDDSDGARVLESGKNEFNLFYETYVGEEEVADVRVIHNYVTNTTYVDADGKVATRVSTEEVKEDKVHGVPGDSFTAELKEKDGFEFDYADTEDLKVTMWGEDGVYNVYYVKEVNELGEKFPVTVQVIGKTYETRLNENGQVETVLVNKEEQAPAELGEYYAGQTATAIPGNYTPAGFTHDQYDTENTPDYQITVNAGGENMITLVYRKDINKLEHASVVVRNHYTIVTKSSGADGKYSETTDTWENTGTVYNAFFVGQTFSTVGKGSPMGYDVDTREGIVQPAEIIKLNEQLTYVDFYWYKEVDMTTPATVQVIHHYEINDANPNGEDRSWVVGDKEEDILDGFYAGQKYIASPNYQNGTFTGEHITDMVPTGAIDASVGIILHSGANVVHIYYVKNIDTRVNTSAKIIHNYYHDSDALAAGTAEATYTETSSVREADSYTADLRPENNGIAYGFVSADPADRTITVSADAEKNVITINYVRTEASYTVVHEYYTNSELDGSVSEVFSAKAGDVVKAADLEKLPTYNDKEYDFDAGKSDEAVTVTVGGENIITLRYYREKSTGGGGSSNTYLTVKKVWKDDNSENRPDSVTVQLLRDGEAYGDAVVLNAANSWDHTWDDLSKKHEWSVEEVDVPEGYTDSVTHSGKIWTITNTLDTTDIPDPEVPGGENPPTDPTDPGGVDVPGTDIPDEQLPKADVPATGDSMMVWVLAAVASGLGLVWMALSSKKRKEENT